MPVLLLARGDKEGRDLLRKALEARYGLGAPAIETLRIQLSGRALTRLGPLTLWLPLTTTAGFDFPGRCRWDFSIRLAGLPLQVGVNAFDGAVFRRQRRAGQLQVVTQPDQVRSARLRLMVAYGMLLTPLTLENIELKATGRRSFEATNTDCRDSVHVTLHDDYTVDGVSTTCLNPQQDNREQLFTFQSVAGQQAVNDFILPEKICILWDNVPEYEVVPVAVESSPVLDDAFFRLESSSQA